MSELLAARIHDPLVHSSLIADVVSGVVEGAICLAALAGGMALMSNPFTAVIGVAVIGVAYATDWPEKIGDFVGKGVDAISNFFGGGGPPDATISSGSPNVFIMRKAAARAAGTVDHNYLNNPVPARELFDAAKKMAVGMAIDILELSQITMPTMDEIWAGTKAVAKNSGSTIKNFATGVWDKPHSAGGRGRQPLRRSCAGRYRRLH